MKVMGRPKEFDREQVLTRAMQLFWARGYEGTSMSDLVEHLQVGRQSLYDTFGDKRALYLAALDWYLDHEGEAPAWSPDQPVRKQLRNLFAAAIDRSLGAAETGCCMLLLAAAERGSVDEAVADRFCSAQSTLEKVMTRRLIAAQRDGEIGRHHDPVALARFLASSLFGLQLTGRTLRDRRHLEMIADTTLSILG
jgi:TetR/AcrR family transcriptional repressor of nem operon